MGSGDFSFSFSVPATPRRPASDAVRYIAAPYDAVAIGREALVRPTGQTAALRLALFQARVLGTCDAFRSLDDHRRAAAATLGADHAGAVDRALQELVRAGLLRDEQSVVSGLASGEDDAPGAIETLFVRTCDRPHELERLLGELDGLLGDSGPDRVAVLDDSRDGQNVSRNAAIVDDCRLRSRCPVARVDRDARRTVLARIAADAGADPDALSWTIEGDPDDATPGYGGNLNLALLLGAGTRFATVDEDAGMEPRAPLPHGRSLSIRPYTDFELRFVDPQGDEREAFPAVGVDPLAAHSEILGRTVAGLVSEFGPQRGHLANRITPHLIHELQTGPRVRLTCNGTLGDPGSAGMAWLFARDAQDYRALCGDRDTGRRLLFGRRLAMWTPDHQLVAGAALMTTTLTGIDDRDLLLPTLPQGRGEDLLFGALVRYLYPGAPCAMLPWMLRHRIADRPGWDRSDLTRARGIGIASFVAERVEDFEDAVPAATAESRSAALGEWLRARADQATAGLVEDLRRHLFERRAQFAAQAGATLRALQPPDWLTADFETVIEAHTDCSDVDDRRLDALAARLRTFAGRYADSLPAWRSAWRWSAERSIEDLVDFDRR